MIDVHAHFAGERYRFPEEWDKITKARVTKVILASDTVAHSFWHAHFCEQQEGAYFCAGVHPAEAFGYLDEMIFALDYLSKQEKCVGIGEIGLDYHYPDPNKPIQRDAFERQILLAEKAGLPVQIHSRDAFDDTVGILGEMREHLKNGFLLHCYSYGAERLETFSEMGAYFSFGGVTCFLRADKVVKSVAACPLDRILSETDSPYMSPFRGETNTPANIPVIVKKLAQIKGITMQEMEAQIDSNAKALFPKLI